MLSLLVGLTGASWQHMMPNMKDYKIVHIDLAISNTRLHTLSSESHVPSRTATFTLPNEGTVLAKLSPYVELFGEKYKEETHYYKDGVLEKVVIARNDSRDCIFRGHLESNQLTAQNSLVLANACPHGSLEATIHTALDSYRLAPAKNFLDSAEWVLEMAKHSHLPAPNLHILYRIADYVDNTPVKCGVSDAGHDQDHDHDYDRQGNHDHDGQGNHDHDGQGNHDHGQDNHNHDGQDTHRSLSELTNWRPSKFNFNFKPLDASRTVELLLVNDYLRYQLYDDSNGATENDAAAIASACRTRYVPMNPTVDIVLIGQISWASGDPYQDSNGNPATPTMNSDGVDVDSLLSLFMAWQASPGMTHHDNAHMLSGYQFTGATIGYAGVFTMCNPSSSGGIEQTVQKGVSVPTKVTSDFVGAVLSHEMGHNWGMSHDTDSTTFIMSATVGGTVPTQFSSNSVAQYGSYIGSYLDTCLFDIPTSAWGDPACGNGFVETGEDCDCGAPSQCPKCCSDTCRFTPTARCAQPSACCDDNCQIIGSSAAFSCRNATGFCDLAEYCDGYSADCPANVYKGSGTPCVDSTYGSGLCYTGQCQSSTKQCASLSPGYVGCSSSQSSCGDLLCDANSGAGCVKFYAANNEAGGAPTYAQVGDGVKCGDGMQCLSGQCTSGASLNPNNQWKYGGWSNCYSCDQAQIRDVSCVSIAYNGNEKTVLEFACSPATRLPATRQCANVTLNCAPASTNPFNVFGSHLADKYGALDKAAKLRELIPSFGRGPFDYTNSKYWSGIKSLGAIPLVIGILCLIWMGVHLSTGKGCGSSRPIADGYTMFERVMPFMILVSLCVLVLIFALLGLYYSGSVNAGVNDPNTGVVALTSQLVADSTTQTQLITVPLTYIATQSDSVLSDIILRISTASGSVVTDVTALNSSILAASVFASVARGFSQKGVNSAQDITVNCSACVAASSLLTLSSSIVGTSSGYTAIMSNLAAVTAGLQDIKYSIDDPNGFQMVETKLSTLETQLTAKVSSLDSYSKKTAQASKILYPLTVIIFIMPILFLLLILGGCVGKNESCFLYSSYISWAVLVLMWILLAVYLPLTAVAGDSCEYMNVAESNLPAALGLDATQAAVVQACLTNASVADALNITSTLLTIESVQLPSNFSNVEMFPEQFALIALQEQIGAMTAGENLTTSGVTLAQQLTRLLQQLNNLTAPQTYNATNVQNANGSLTITQTRDDILTVLKATSTGQSQLDNLTYSLTAMLSSISRIGADEAYLKRQLDQVQTSLEGFMDAPRNLLAHAYCGFVGTTYASFKYSWCGTIATALSFVSFTTFMIGALTGPIIFLTVSMAKRIAHGVETMRKSIRAGSFRKRGGGPSDSSYRGDSTRREGEPVAMKQQKPNYDNPVAKHKRDHSDG